MVDYSGPDLGLRAAQMPTLLDEIHRKTVQRAQIGQVTRAEDAAQRTQRAYQMLEGIDEQPSTGYGSLFGQRGAAQNEFRTVDDAAAYLRATDPEGMQTRQAALGDFMANQALPRLTSVTDPAQRVAVLKQMAASGPPMLNRLVRDIAADGVITDDELKQAEGMYGSYRKEPTAGEMPWTVAGSNLVNRATGEFRTPPTPEGQTAYDFGGEAKNLAEAHRALADENAPPAVKQAARAFIADYEAQTAARRRSNQPRPTGGGSGITIEEDEEGRMRVQIGGKAPSSVVTDAARISRTIAEATPDLREYAALLNEGVPSYSAGMVGSAVQMVVGVGSQIGVSDAIRRAASAVGQRPTPMSESKRLRVRALADRLRNSIGPIITSSLKGAPSNKDMQRAEEAIGLLQSSGSVEEAQLRLSLIWRGLQAAQNWSNTVVQTGRVPVSEELGDMPGARPVPRPGGAPANAPARPNRARDLLNRMKSGG